MMTQGKFFIRRTVHGPKIEFCFPVGGDTYATASVNWCSKREKLSEQDMFFSYEAARDQRSKILQGEAK